MFEIVRDDGTPMIESTQSFTTDMDGEESQGIQ